MSTLELSESDRAMLEGEGGPAEAMAMRVVSAAARASGASRLVDIVSAHIDGALYSGQVSLDFARRLVELGGRTRVPATLNVSSLDLLHPELYRGPDEVRDAARATMKAYEELGCRPTWTCAPYQLESRPAFGDHVAWAESNAIVFANSVLGARTDRFGDFIDISAAVCGRAPLSGLFLDENRLAGVIYDVSDIFPEDCDDDTFFAVLGLLIGSDCGRVVPVVVGIAAATEDQLKAMGAAAATAGSVAMIHVVGITPEAPTLEDATCGGRTRRVLVTKQLLDETAASIGRADSGSTLRTINLGTPHYSTTQIERLRVLLGDRNVHQDVTLYVNTGRDVLAAAPDAAELETRGVTFVTDTCTYITPIISTTDGMALTDSAKWAYYAPGNLGVEVRFASVAACVESAVLGQVVDAGWPWR